jgi:hypothetical protein
MPMTARRSSVLHDIQRYPGDFGESAATEKAASVREASSSTIANARTRRTIAPSLRPEAARRNSRTLNPCDLNCSRHPPPLSNRTWRIANHIPQFLRTRESGIQPVSITCRPPRPNNDITPGWNSPKTPPNLTKSASGKPRAVQWCIGYGVRITVVVVVGVI